MQNMRWMASGTVMLGLAVTTLVGTPRETRAQQQPEAPTPEAMPSPEEIRAIWPANLQKIAGRYVFAQVASPGGLWETFTPKKGDPTHRQVSLNELPAAFRNRLLKAEITISQLQAPTVVQANQRLSPSKRGMLRFYSEAGMGRVEVKNLPGVAGRDGDTGNFKGPVALRLEHQSHSNPSVNGVLYQRLQAEKTWGAATLDYADLLAHSLPPAPKPESGKAAPEGAGAAKEEKEAKEAKEDKEEHEDEHAGETVLTNARILRSGVEIFAFVEWTEKTNKGDRRIMGSVRLMKQDDAKPQTPAPPLDGVTSRL